MSYIEVNNLRYKYPTDSDFALKGLTFGINKGEIIGLVGPNDAGKSTLCQAFVGLVPNFTKGTFGGSVNLDGLIIHKATPDELVKNIGIVFQNPFTQITAAKLTVYEEIAFGLENLGIPREQMIDQIEQALHLLDIYQFKDRNPFSLSGGQMQRLAIASVIAMKPEVIVFDEPTSQLDPQGTEEVFEAIRKLAQNGMTIIIAEHKLEKIAKYCDRVLFLVKGQLVAYEKPEELFNRLDLMELGLEYPVFTEVCKSLEATPSETHKPVNLEEATQWVIKHRNGTGN